MMKTLIASTALIGVMSTMALPVQAQQAETQPSLSFNIFSSEVSAVATVSTNGYLSAESGQVLASDLIGQPVYDYDPAQVDQDAEPEAIGNINDIVMDPGGDARAAVIGVGGFLGIGEKSVAMAFDRLQWMTWNGERRLVISSSREELEQAPEFNADALNLVHNDALLVVDQSNLSAEKLIGTPVYGEGRKALGEIGDVILDPQQQVRSFVVDVGGFLGLGEKPVSMSAADLTVFRDAEGELHIYTPYTEEQLSALPEYRETDPVVLGALR